MFQQRREGGAFASQIHMFRKELEDIMAGYIKLPWDMNIKHRQMDPLHIIDQSSVNPLLAPASACLH